MNWQILYVSCCYSEGTISCFSASSGTAKTKRVSARMNMAHIHESDMFNVVSYQKVAALSHNLTTIILYSDKRKQLLKNDISRK